MTTFLAEHAATRRPQIRTLAARADAPVRLYCVPPAGMGAAAFYLPWTGHMPGDIELCGVELPGQGPLAGPPIPSDAERLGYEIAEEIRAEHDTRPFAVFGHSAGALLGYLAARHLRDTGHDPFLLAVSALPAPHRSDYARLMARVATEGRKAFCDVFDLPSELFDDDPVQLMAVLTPIIASVMLTLQYRHTARPLPRTALAIYGGRDDAVADHRQLAAWNDLAAEPSVPRLFPGAHMYVLAQPGAVADYLAADVRAAARAALRGGDTSQTRA
ncbi:thioesterase domain-containing protein [Spirillospora sp. NPDC029432]|uniref:thioesterase II family protein n=1 Tax=Spirillospora sp. NPDC029432 TaxID=3154599 RepID=UPI003451922B